ncbi:helix-turn-helix domain-containing protein [Halobacillus sp. A5]|uniref:helix-turn-helix domain-containing protein n=1 Tax=Halobacillus sp. A5 TaxID=2880263 RepID=UPI0020A668B4|nr:helix-turn-helix domain-containing protein [Halobacillus sp. A5]MCP3027786.1 helix-turn-helix domain-containing protein [Halobacillus sp. A5]
MVIAERDKNESIAIEWLISTYSIPIHEVFIAHTVKETMTLLEKERPDLLYLELDMISNENWSLVTRNVKKNAPKTIAVTAEATFERAKQAIALGCVDLLVKPLDPVNINQNFRMALSLVTEQETPQASLVDKGEEEPSYRSLFLDRDLNHGEIGLMLLHPENNKKLADLHKFSKYFPFREPPIVLPLSDMVICLFRNPTQHLREEAWKILRDWETTNIDPLAAVIIPPNTVHKTIHDMYLSARRLLEITFFIGYSQVILPNDSYDAWQEIDPFLTSVEQREWVEMLNQFDKQQIKHKMHQEFLQMETPFPNPEKLRIRLTSILAQVRRFMKIYQLDQGEMEEHYMRIFSEILFNRVLYRIVQEMLLFLYELLDRSNTEEVFSKKDVIERGILYIENHYSDPDLTLQHVADAVGRSPAYFSHLLMKKQGTPFRQQLANKRVEEAKQLLTGTQLSIKEVAEQTGFRHPSYFTKLFKEFTTMAPREYREYMRNG